MGAVPDAAALRDSAAGGVICETEAVMTYLIIIVVIAVVALVAVGAVLLRPRWGRGRAPAAPPAERVPPGRGAEEDAPGPPGPLTTVAEAPAAPPVEAAQPLAGRMTRLRGRLARSQTGFGSVL